MADRYVGPHRHTIEDCIEQVLDRQNADPDDDAANAARGLVRLVDDKATEMVRTASPDPTREVLRLLVELGPASHEFTPWDHNYRGFDQAAFDEAVRRGELHPTCSSCSASNNELTTRSSHERWGAWQAAKATLATLPAPPGLDVVRTRRVLCEMEHEMRHPGNGVAESCIECLRAADGLISDLAATPEPSDG